MIEVYFKYPKFLFFGLQVYAVYILANAQSVTIGLTEIVFALILPFIPIWSSSYFFKKLAKDLNGSLLNIGVYLSHALVISLASYAIISFSIVEGSPVGLLASFGIGAISFFFLFCVILMLSVFAKDT